MQERRVRRIGSSWREIAQCPEALHIVSQATEIVLGRKLVVGEGPWDMIRSMSLETVCEMIGAGTTEGFLEILNKKLIEIDKKII